MQRAPWWARRRRRLIGLYWLAQLVAVYFVSLPLTWMNLEEPSFLRTIAPLVFVAVFFGLQMLFLLPVRRPRAGTGGVSVLISLAVGGLLVAALAAAAVIAIAQLVGAYGDDFEQYGWLLLGAVMGGTWLISTPLLIAFCRRGQRERVLRRLSAGLFLGTMIEAAAIIPLDVLVRRREDCICATGTYLALAICSAVGLFVLGPAILVPLLARQRRRWYAGHCEVCGYDMSGKRDADCCPECGAGWRRKAEG